MAMLVGHGGGCCGMRHIYTFRDDDDENVRSLRQHTTAEANNNLNLEVILSNRQTEQYPRLIAELARLGYVYTTSWIGQHQTPVHLFHRAANRLALTANGFGWTGMMANEAISGRLPTMAAARVGVDLTAIPADERPAVRRAEGAGFDAGQMVRIHSPTSRYHGERHRIIRFSDTGHPAYTRTAVFRVPGERERTFAIVLANLRPDDVVEEGYWHRIANLERLPRDCWNGTVYWYPALNRFVTMTRVTGVAQGNLRGDHVAYFADYETGQPIADGRAFHLRELARWVGPNPPAIHANVEARRARANPVDANLPEFRHPVLAPGQRAPAAPPRPTMILTECFALFADGRERGPFENAAAVREAYPRVRRYMRRTIMSDGTIDRTPFDIRRDGGEEAARP